MDRFIIISTLILTTCGCASFSRVPPPDELLGQYISNIEGGDLEAAYLLLSDSQRQQLSLDEFRQAVENYPEELEAQARDLRRQMSEPIPVSAEMRLESGEVVTFVLQDGQWKITEGVAGAVSLASPLQAIRALRRSLQRRSYSSVIRVLSREARGQLEDEVSRIVEGLQDEESLNIEFTGNRARVIYDDNHFVDLQREDGEWVIVDMN